MTIIVFIVALIILGILAFVVGTKCGRDLETKKSYTAPLPASKKKPFEDAPYTITGCIRGSFYTEQSVTKQRDHKIYIRMRDLYLRAENQQAKDAVLLMWENHLLPAHLLFQKAHGEEGAKGRYNHQLNIIDGNLAVLEAGYNADIELQQREMTRHLEMVRDSMIKPPIDMNLDLSKSKEIESRPALTLEDLDAMVTRMEDRLDKLTMEANLRS